jgi:F0F1-type ATP synthase assembly protein I
MNRLPANDRPTDDRSAMAIAMSWATRIMVIAAEMVVPGLLGYYFLDKWLGTKMLFLLLGLGLGMTGAILHLVSMTKSMSQVSHSSIHKPPHP